MVTRSAKRCWWRRSWITQSMLRLSLLEPRRNIDALKLWSESSYATPGLFQGSVPMHVSAVNDGGKGKKGKNKMTGGKGKDKRKHSKSKERDSWLEQWLTTSTIPRLLLTLLKVEKQTHHTHTAHPTPQHTHTRPTNTQQHSTTQHNTEHATQKQREEEKRR